MSISSVVSYHQREVLETIPGMLNAIYRIPPSKNVREPQILHISDSAYYKPDIEGHQDEIFVPSGKIADSIVHMCLTSQLGYDIEAHPAIFAIIDEMVSPETLIKNYPERVKTAIRKQRKWFEVLVRMADDDWQVAHRHGMVSDIQRSAARELGLKREWLMTLEDESDLSSCPFCGSNLLNPSAPICPHCHQVHNPAKFKELQDEASKLIKK